MENKNTEYDYHLTAQDVGELLGYNTQYVRVLAREGKLPGLQRRRQWFFSEREIMKQLREMTIGTKIERKPNDTKGSAPSSDLF